MKGLFNYETKFKEHTKHGAKKCTAEQKSCAKKKKAIIISCVSAVLVVALIITLVVVFKKNNAPDISVTTTYKISEVTKGNVSTTISGSGSLTPIKSETLTAVELIEELEEEDEEEDEEETESAEGNESTEESESTEGTESTEGAENGEENADEGISTAADLGYINEMGGAATTPVIPQPAVIVGGKIDSVSVKAGATVKAGDVIAVIVFDTEESEESADEDAIVEAETRNIVAPYDAVILELYLHAGDEVTDSTSVAMFMSTEGYTMTISVDETNISAIEIGQDVEIKIDSSSAEMPVGEVTDISYNGSTSGSTTYYKITVNFDYVEATYPGMAVSAEIVIEDSGEGLLVPVSAVNTSGDTKYVYLAPANSALADIYEEGEIDLNKLTKATVTTGMSDGSYIMLESGNLSEGDLIVVITRTSNMTSSNTSSGSGGGRGEGFGGGGFGGGGFGGGGFPGGSMPEGFDPSNMPSGGRYPFGN